tara:strand:- start:133 stop:669 length:537 start_codon:yes stop_codon:yes gene_type:complete
MVRFENLEKHLEAFKKYVIQQSKSNLTKNGKKATGNLYNSIDAESKVSQNSFELDFLMEQYGEFVDLGVKGKTSSSKAPNSPFKFGTGSGRKGGLTQGIDKWVKLKGIQFKDKKTGRFLSYQSTAFLITRGIYNKGIKPTLFFTKPFEKGFKRLDDEMIEAFGLDVDEFLKFTLKNIK